MSVRVARDKKGNTIPGVYVIDVYIPGGKGKRLQTRFTGTEEEAIAVEQHLRRNAPKSSSPPISAVFPEYLQWHRIHRAPRTTKDVILSWKNLRQVFAHLPVAHITPIEIDRYKRLRSGRSPRTINKELDYLKAIISWMVARGYANPLSFTVEKIKYKKKLPSIPAHRDVLRFIACLPKRLKPMALLMYLSGLRSDEAKNLRWEDVGEDTVTVRLSKTEERLALWPSEVDKRIERKASGLVFPSPRQNGSDIEKPYTNILRSFKTASDKSGVKINPHLLRHCNATYMLEATGDLRLVQHVLGHKDIATTTVYTHIAADRMKTGFAAMRAYQQTTSKPRRKKGPRKKA
jgi:integrase/recombinase XerD